MVLIGLTILLMLVGVVLAITGYKSKKKKRLINGICIILLTLIAMILSCIYVLEKEEEELENQNVGQISENTTIPTPDRIIYKNQNNEYIIINPDTSAYDKIYYELYERITNVFDGKVYSEEEISEMQNEGSFIEFDYYTKSKNFVFLLEKEGIGLIKRLNDSGQVIKSSLDDVEKLVKKVNKLTEKETRYDFNKEYSYISENKLLEIPQDDEFIQERVGIYQKEIYNEEDLKRSLQSLNFKTDRELPKVDFYKQNVIITLSQYEIKNIKQNIGNIKYEFGNLLNAYTANVLITSKIVNNQCMYYNINDSNGYLTTYEADKYVKNSTTGVITKINDNQIEIGLGKNIPIYVAKIKDSTEIIDYETINKLSITDLKIGDSIYVEGEVSKDENNLKAIVADKINICSKEKVKSEVEKYLKDTYRLDGMGINYTSLDSYGEGYIIIGYFYEKFIYPIKLNVNNQTETYLGMGYHLQANYGYILHEMCDITLDTKITDIDNIKGLVKTIEYIAD